MKTVHAFTFRAEQAHTYITRKMVTKRKEIGNNVGKEEKGIWIKGRGYLAEACGSIL